MAEDETTLLMGQACECSHTKQKKLKGIIKNKKDKTNENLKGMQILLQPSSQIGQFQYTYKVVCPV